MHSFYINNKGFTKTILSETNKYDKKKIRNCKNEVTWDADYNGKDANIFININNDGVIDKYKIQLNNEDIAQLLNIQSVPINLENRLHSDFEDLKILSRPKLVELPIEDFKTLSRPKLLELPIEDSFQPSIYTHLSSPLPNEEFIVPIPLNESIKKLNSYSNKINKSNKLRKYKSRKIYKKPNSLSKKSLLSKRTTTKSRSKSRKTM